MANLLLRFVIILVFVVAFILTIKFLIYKGLTWIQVRFGDTALIAVISAMILSGIIEYFVKLYRKKNQQNF